MSCVVSPASSHARSAACRSFVLLLGAVGVVGMTEGAAAQANGPGATPATTWCIVRNDQQQPECVYDNLVTCGMNAILKGGQCAKAEWTAPPTTTTATTTAAVPPRPRRKPPQRKLTTAEQNDKLFREFERWKESGK